MFISRLKSKIKRMAGFKSKSVLKESINEEKEHSSHMIRTELPLPSAVRKVCGNQDESQSLILSYVFEQIKVNSIADFGCGYGNWLKKAIELGVSEFKGFDLPEIPVDERLFPAEGFESVDLSKPLYPKDDYLYDLVVSTEVAEHIDNSSAEVFVDNLCRHSNAVLFSAAIPYQGGASHVHENWIEYWANLFSENGYVSFDILREEFWHDSRVASYYKHNCIIFVKKNSASYLELIDKGHKVTKMPISIIHPETYLKIINQNKNLASDRLEKDIRFFYVNLNK